MSKATFAFLLAAVLAGVAIGVVVGHPLLAQAQEKPAGAPAEKPPATTAPAAPATQPAAKAADVTEVLKPAPVVSALAYQTQTEYEQDPFEPTRLRRTTATVTRVLVVRSDGTMEIKSAP